MKSRSHRPSTNDEWVEEESWTVDCICGVNFDDGDEMVNCDECGVWVHTRCSRYVKSEKLFACDKCKNKNTRNDSEETEVARLLVELPTKTLRMENPPSYNPSTLPPSRRPFRLWTDIPIEERVHVQGVPGGDPGLFTGLSSVFGQQLWKSTGYIPKKFNFRYREFPYEEGELLKEEVEKKNSRDTHSTADSAGVLLSMSKENLLSVTALGSDVEAQAEDVKDDMLKTSEQRSNLEGQELEVSGLPDGLKDQSLLQSSGKRKKEDLATLKDKNGNKKARIVEKDGDLKKKSSHTPTAAWTNPSDTNVGLQFCEDRGPKAIKGDPQICKSTNLSNNLSAGQLPKGHGLVDHVTDEHKSQLASSKSKTALKTAFDASIDSSTSAIMSKEDKAGQEAPAKLDGSPRVVDGAASPIDHTDSGAIPDKGEVVYDAVDRSNRLGDGISTSITADISQPIVENVVASLGKSNASDSTINMVATDSTTNMVPSNLDLNAKSNAELGGTHGVIGLQPSPGYDSKLDTTGTLAQCHENSADCSSEIEKANSAAMTPSEAVNKEYAGGSSGLLNSGNDRPVSESADDHHESMQDSGGSEDYLRTKQESTLCDLKSVDELIKYTGRVPSQSIAMGECKVILSVGNSSLASSADILVTKSFPANCMNIPVQSQDMDSKQKGTCESSLSIANDNDDTSAEVIKDEEKHERRKKLVKELSKSSLNSVSKLQSKKVLHSSSKRRLHDSKETMLHSTPKSPPLPNVSATPCSEPSSMLHIEGAPTIQKKASILQTENASNIPNIQKAAVIPQKGEKISQSVPHSSSKSTACLAHATTTSSNSPATLSDEELALLLHQELNSSPRVPRVPRMRHAGSLPQLTSPTAPNMLMKRTSSTGGKEHILTFRRKFKDSAKDGSHVSREVDDETKKMERMLLSADNGRQESLPVSNLVSKRESDGVPTKVAESMKKGNASISGATAASALSSATAANENNLSSARQSPGNPHDDGKGGVGRPIHRTLPGLIADIMSKGERMTYEELCNAVLPHWPNLRKHNGERYAYSSHSQAVLDCLRNRSEWARLVDRGPKTSGGRKRRKLDADSAGIDSDDNEDNQERSAKDVKSKSVESHHEEFPKGKRNARKRRRLALQGRGIKDIRRQRRIEESSDEEIASLSNSSEDTALSADESQGVGNSRAGNEVSPSSDGIGSL